MQVWQLDKMLPDAGTVSYTRQLVPLGLDLGEHGQSALHLVCAKSALGVPRVRVVAELLAEELGWAQRASDELRAKPRLKKKGPLASRGSAT